MSNGKWRFWLLPIRLNAEETKTNENRIVPLHKEVIEAISNVKKVPKVPNVFTYNGQVIKEVRRSFLTACKEAEIENFRFHDLRHTAITNWRRQGHDYFKIMAASGHKTMATFKRYNTVSKDDLRSLVEK